MVPTGGSQRIRTGRIIGVEDFFRRAVDALANALVLKILECHEYGGIELCQ